MLEKIEWQGEILALVLREAFDKEGVNFVTAEGNPLQLGVLKHHQGVKIKPHIHRASSKVINITQEALHLEYGKVLVQLYNDMGENIRSMNLYPGDTILFISGGHGLDILEDSKIIEVKQGPYEGPEEDKKLLETNGG